jgi:hypothetical protein
MNLSAAQRLALEVVALRRQRLDDDVRAAELVTRFEVAGRTAILRAGYEEAVVEANIAGVPKAQIARAVGTTNPKPIREILNRAARARRSTVSNRYSRGGRGGLLLVRLDGDDLASACKATGWTVDEAVTAGVDRAAFEVSPSLMLVSETPSFVPDLGRLHPTVSWLRGFGSAEALAWWTETL